MKTYGKIGVLLPKDTTITILDDERLLDLYKMLKPIVVVDGEKFLCKEYNLEELKNHSYSFNWNRRNDKREMIDPDTLEPVEDFVCLHSHLFGYYCWFMPTVAEVLSQAPIKTIREANVFEIIEAPQTINDMFRYKNKNAINNGLHLSKIRSYKMHSVK